MTTEPLCHGEPIIFKLADQSFRLRPLKPIPSLRGLAILQKTLLPLIQEFAGLVELDESGKVVFGTDNKPKMRADVNEGSILSIVNKALSVTENLPEFYSLFVDACDVLVAGQFLPIAAWGDSTFGRRGTLLVAWIGTCIQHEYRDFLSETGQSILREMASGFGFLLGSPGNSGS